ncbi:MAG: YggT family protein [Desulfovibrionaceae bacterium]|nr:YggT family protein [Desulfovibrionaceae bacterium]
MILISNLITGIASLLGTLCSLYMWVFIFNAILSWVQPNPFNPVVSFLRSLTEPVLYRIRKFFPLIFNTGIDFSPLVAILFLQLFNSIVVQTLYEYGLRLK